MKHWPLNGQKRKLLPPPISGIFSGRKEAFYREGTHNISNKDHSTQKSKVMNTPYKNILTPISEAETKNLNTVANETLAFEWAEKKALTATDLWSIQRQKRSLLQRRHSS
jgi:hypothetical protein